MRYWDDKDGNGKPLTDGRICLVIENPGMPLMRTYGRDKEEVLDKLAKTTETAQVEINRLRAKPSTPAAPVARVITADEQARATADLSDPSKSPQAVQTLLRAAGVPVDQMKLDQDVRRIAAIAEEWEAQHPDFPHDPRNQRLLVNTAALRVGIANITAVALDAAYQELAQHGMLFDVEPEPEPAPVVTVPPGGSQESRTVRATSYRSNNLRTPVPIAQEKPKWTRAQVDTLNSRQLREKIETEPGFEKWLNETMAAKSA